MRFRKNIYSGLATIGLTLCLGAPSALADVNVFVQPTNQVVLAGSNATFTAVVGATAGEVITGYTWLMSTNGQNPFTTVGSGVSFTITNVQTGNAGFYFVRVAYASGTNEATTASTAVTLTVPDQARFTAHPQGLIRATDGSASFSVAALGAQPLTYQWRYNGANLVDDTRINGATTTHLTIAGLVVLDSGDYDVVVSNAFGMATSQIATLNVFMPPSISVEPQSIIVISGSNAILSVTVNGSPPLGFRWKKGAATLSNSGRISGATSNTLTITGALTSDNGNYSVFITNVVGSVVSAAATLTVVIPPTITSETNATGRQGAFFSYLTTATGTLPITFGAEGLPTGLSIEPTDGLISGIPAVSGVFDVTLFATNPGITTTQQLVITLTTGVPGITSELFVNGLQGQFFSYTISASNDPVSFSASSLPLGLSFDPTTGVISGPPVVSGSFPLTIGASNQYGADSQILTLDLASALPVITSPLTASGTENQPGFSYSITASNSPTQYGASGLPLGLTVNTNTGDITGTPLYGGTFNVLIWADNAWGTGSNILTLDLTFAAINGLAIADVAHVYSSPYLLDFSFSLRDDTNAATSNPVVRPLSQLQVVCMEDGKPIGTETARIVDRGNKKQLKTFLVLDYSFSMFISAGAIDGMQAAAKTFINGQPGTAQFGIYEFHADYVDPQLVTGFTSDKEFLSQTIDGIQTNYVMGNYAGTRAFDALHAALSQFGPANRDEQRYVIVMTDGNDESSLLNTNADPIDVLVTLAQSKQVRVFCVAYGPDINIGALQQLTTNTLGRYYEAATTADLADQFLKIVKDIDGQYLLRWATLKRAPKLFQPSFQITVDGFTATFNTNAIYITNIVVVTNPPPTVTNTTVTKITDVPDYNPPDWAGDVRVGEMRLVADADVGPQTVRLRATYAPRFVREIRLNYRPNYPCTASLNSTGPGEILSGWSMTETNDGTNGFWLTLVSPNPTDLLTSIPYGAFGDLITFKFLYPDLLTGQKAFSVLAVDNTIYTNLPPTGQSFVLENRTNFITLYEPTPPYGTPIPWLIAYGFTNNFAAAELSDPNTNGLAVWQEYLAGLNPLDPNSTFAVQLVNAPPAGPPQIIFSTVEGRTYRLESALSLDTWTVLRDNISGTGGIVSFTDFRDLSGVSAAYYRVAVY